MNLEYNEYQDYFKVIVVGNSGVGKSNIIQTYNKGARPNHINPTIGVDYFSKVISMENNVKVKIQIWDTAGQQQYRSITMSHYRAASGALLVFDVTNRNSFTDISKWITDVRDRANQNVVIGIIGNKVDSDRRNVSREQGENLASKQHAFYMETSIYDLGSLKNAFERLAQQINRNNKSKNLEFSRTNLELSNTSKSDNCSC